MKLVPDKYQFHEWSVSSKRHKSTQRQNQNFILSSAPSPVFFQLAISHYVFPFAFQFSEMSLPFIEVDKLFCQGVYYVYGCFIVIEHGLQFLCPLFYILFLLRSCISRLKYFSDFRPYFTIHDSEFKEYTTRTQAP